MVYLIPILVDWRNFLKGQNGPSMKVFQEAMSQLTVREAKRQYRILRISTGCDTSMRITDEVSLLNWIPHFAVHF